MKLIGKAYNKTGDIFEKVTLFDVYDSGKGYVFDEVKAKIRYFPEDLVSELKEQGYKSMNYWKEREAKQKSNKRIQANKRTSARNILMRKQRRPGIKQIDREIK